MPIVLKKHHAKYKVNTTEDKGVTKLMPSPSPELSPSPSPGPINFYFERKPEPGNEPEPGAEPGIEHRIEPEPGVEPGIEPEPEPEPGLYLLSIVLYLSNAAQGSEWLEYILIYGKLDSYLITYFIIKFPMEL